MDSTVHLPAISEIEASTDVLSIRTNAIKVVRVKEHFAVKIGYAIPPLEAENMKYVAANSKVSVIKGLCQLYRSRDQENIHRYGFHPRGRLAKVTTIAHTSREDDGQRAD